eukprot:XP_015573757.1 probable LRR receptor-like serine/threonine-protein kinase At3g47570 [Ricinus communis]
MPVTPKVHMKVKSCALSLVFLLHCISLLWLQADASGNETDRIALLKFKEGMTSDPQGIFHSWNDSLPFCNWLGFTCGSRHQRVTSLELDGKEFIWISITIYWQPELSQLTWNNLKRKIPAQLGSLVNLEELRLLTNNRRGEIPASLGNLSSIRIFHVTLNNLVGHIPDDMGRLTSLTTFAVGVNKISGVIPPSIFNFSSLTRFEVTPNQLIGSLSNNIGLTLPNLQFLGFGENNFIRSIPETLFNSSQLEIFDLGFNNFVGPVPVTLGNLKNLWKIRLHRNNLGSNSSNDLLFLPP